jgi:hypothetical protein
MGIRGPEIIHPIGRSLRMHSPNRSPASGRLGRRKRSDHERWMGYPARRLCARYLESLHRGRGVCTTRPGIDRRPETPGHHHSSHRLCSSAGHGVADPGPMPAAPRTSRTVTHFACRRSPQTLRLDSASTCRQSGRRDWPACAGVRTVLPFHQVSSTRSLSRRLLKSKSAGSLFWGLPRGPGLRPPGLAGYSPRWSGSAGAFAMN